MIIRLTSKIKYFIIPIILLLTIVLGTVTTIAIWEDQLETQETPTNSSGDWIESEKYFDFTEIIEGATIVGYAVSDYKGLIDNVQIPRVHLGKPVTTIKGTFVNNLIIREIIIPDTVIIIEGYAFLNFTRLQKVIIRGGQTNLTIGDYAFMNCTTLSIFEMDSDRLLSISDTAFYNTTGVTKPSVN